MWKKAPNYESTVVGTYSYTFELYTFKNYTFKSEFLDHPDTFEQIFDFHTFDFYTFQNHSFESIWVGARRQLLFLLSKGNSKMPAFLTTLAEYFRNFEFSPPNFENSRALCISKDRLVQYFSLHELPVLLKGSSQNLNKQNSGSRWTDCIITICCCWCCWTSIAIFKTNSFEIFRLLFHHSQLQLNLANISKLVRHTLKIKSVSKT